MSINETKSSLPFVTEPARDLPVTASVDVLVCGGGVAGIAAALAARRTGASVLLLEREYLLGGLATAGLIAMYLPICDGRGRQVCFGIAEELLRLSVSRGGEDRHENPWLTGSADPEAKKHIRFLTQYNPQLFAILAEQLLTAEGADILYGTSVCAALTDAGHITHIIIENKSGRSAVKVGCVVDATGDADVCRLAGEDTDVFRQGNVPAGWYCDTLGGTYNLRVVGACDKPDSRKSADELERDRASLRFAGLEADELSRLTRLSHKLTLDDFLSRGEDSPSHALATVATVPQIRMTRRLAGVYTQDETEIGVRYDDSVGLFPDWRHAGPVYEMPLRTLYGHRIGNLLAAGRCISGTDAMWDITRVIPVCAVSGQAAGTAAAMCARRQCGVSVLDVTELQGRLSAAGVRLHDELGS